MLIDTHCHLNFGAFEGRVEGVINDARAAGVDQIIIPGTDIETSKKAIEIAEKFEGVYAAIGIHPHHIFEILQKERSSATQIFQKTHQTEKFAFASDLSNIENLLKHSKIVAIGEVGIDRHIYTKTKYPGYKIEEEFVELQKIFLTEQIKLAIKYDKSLILHNREARKDTLGILEKDWDKKLEGRAVFHCCEPDPVGTIHELSLLKFAKRHEMFIGIDGDIFYKKDKQAFIKTVPMEMLVLETDSPFLSPDRKSQNEPKNIKIIAEFVAELKGIPFDLLAKQTTENARVLFKVSP